MSRDAVSENKLNWTEAGGRLGSVGRDQWNQRKRRHPALLIKHWRIAFYINQQTTVRGQRKSELKSPANIGSVCLCLVLKYVKVKMKQKLSAHEQSVLRFFAFSVCWRCGPVLRKVTPEGPSGASVSWLLKATFLCDAMAHATACCPPPLCLSPSPV